MPPKFRPKDPDEFLEGRAHADGAGAMLPRLQHAHALLGMKQKGRYKVNGIDIRHA